MPPEQWAEIREIVETALELTGAEQATYVNRACAGKPECRAEVESLLEAGVHAGDFLEHSPVASLPDAPLHLVAHEVIGHRIGPYQITKIIGEGGMAVIYEAVRVDGEFEHRVAVKMVKAGLVPEAIAARFKVERQILAGLRHPSIAQLLDGGVSDGVPYFILELVEGKHIDEYCNYHRLAAGQRLALFGQVCDAVQYAHSKGIIHRDIKPGNILVSDEGVVKLLDFGIAKILRDTSQQTATRTEHRMATPNYASPEQIAGEPITVRSDVYSLGILLYELISGRQAIPTGECSSVQPLDRPSVVARSNDARLPARWWKALDLVIMKAVHRDAARRYSTVQDLSLDVQHVQEGKPVQARGDGVLYKARKLAGRQRMLVTGVVALAVGVAISVGSWWHWRRAIAPVGRKSVAVVGFQDLSETHADEWLSTALSEMFTTELAANPKLRVVSGDRVTRAKRDLGVDGIDISNTAQLASLRQNLDAQYILTGSYLSEGENSQSLRLYVRLQDAKSGETLIASTGNGLRNELPAVVFRSAGQLQHQLGLEVPAKPPTLVYAADSRAVQLYAEGLQEQRRGNAASARKAFEAALSIEPNSPVVRSAYASTLSDLGYDQRAAEAAKIAFEGSSGLPREQRLLLEGRYHEYEMDWKRAIESYRALWSSFNGDTDYGILLAHAQNRAGLPDEVLKTVKALENATEPVGADPRAMLEEANAYLYKADFAAMEAAALRARKSAEKLGARTWVADAYAVQGNALINENKYAAAVQAFSTAQRLYASLHDEAGWATASRGIGAANSEQGNYAIAEQYYSEALKTFSRLGFRRGEALTLSNLSVVKKLQSDFPAALKLMEQCIAVQEDIGDKLSLSHTLLNYGSTLRKLNSLADAKAALARSLQLAREIGDPEQIVRVLVMLGDTEIDSGDLADGLAQEQEALNIHTRPGASPRVHALVLQHVAFAKQHMGILVEAKSGYQASLDIGRKNNLRQYVADNLVMLSEVDRQQGDLEASNRLLREADGIYRKEHQREGLADVLLEEAKNDLAANRLEGLRERLERCRSAFHELGLGADESDAAVTLAEYWLRQSGPSQAAAALPAAQIPRFVLRMRRAIVASRIAAAQGEARDAVRRLKAISADLAARSWMELSLEARLASAQAEWTFNRSAARSDLAALKQDTGSLGFVLLSRIASELQVVGQFRNRR
jgi:tetratricopeptide (TPR) repeat protein